MAGLKPRPFKDHNESFRNLAKNERDIAHPLPWPASHCESTNGNRHQQPTDNEVGNLPPCPNWLRAANRSEEPGRHFV